MLNIHYYDESILETARLQEAVHLQTHIISEYPCEEDMEAIEPYKDRVEFVEVIKDDLENLYVLEEKIEELNLGIRLEELNIRNIEKKMIDAELCSKVLLRDDIDISKAIINNCKERIDILDKTW